MTRRIGLLSVSLSILGLAVAGYFVQGAGAGSAPVEVADFGVPAAAIAAASGGDEYDVMPGDTSLFHPAAAPAKAACVQGSGLGLVAVTDDIAILCRDDEILGYLVTADTGETKLVDRIAQKEEECASEKDEAQPDA